MLPQLLLLLLLPLGFNPGLYSRTFIVALQHSQHETGMRRKTSLKATAFSLVRVGGREGCVSLKKREEEVLGEPNT